jgi:hypothetical protein
VIIKVIKRNKLQLKHQFMNFGHCVRIYDNNAV